MMPVNTKRCQACGRLYNTSDILELDGMELCMFCAVICLDGLSREEE